jgi:hypothetical protein
MMIPVRMVEDVMSMDTSDHRLKRSHLMENGESSFDDENTRLAVVFAYVLMP